MYPRGAEMSKEPEILDGGITAVPTVHSKAKERRVGGRLYALTLSRSQLITRV